MERQEEEQQAEEEQQVENDQKEESDESIISRIFKNVPRSTIERDQTTFFLSFVKPLEEMVYYGKESGDEPRHWIQASIFLSVEEAAQQFMETNNIPYVELDDHIGALWHACSLYMLDLYSGELMAYMYMKTRINYTLRTYNLALLNFYKFREFQEYPKYKEKLLEYSKGKLKILFTLIQQREEEAKNGKKGEGG
jgi:hypothetical protein